MAKEPRFIRIGPSNWVETVDLLLVIIRDGDGKGYTMARTELLRCASIADMYVADHPELVTVTEESNGTVTVAQADTANSWPDDGSKDGGDWMNGDMGDPPPRFPHVPGENGGNNA